jgi:DNA phosphorothioation-dependent restriction protein DptG
MIVFDSKLPKAMEYKYAVAKLAHAFMKGEIIAYTDHYQSACYKRNIAAKRFKEIDRLPWGEKQNAMDKLANDIGITRATAQAWKGQYTHDNTLDDTRRTACHTRVVKEHISQWKEIQDLLSRGLSVAEVAEKAGVCLNTVYRYINRYSKRYGNKISK